MDRKQLKAQSKNLIRTAQPKPVVTAIIYLLIVAVLGFLSYKLVGGSTFELQSIYEQFGIDGAYGSIDPDQFAYAIEQAMPSPGAALLNLAVSIVALMIGAGFTIYCLRTVRGMEASYWNLFDAFGMFFRVIWLYILEGIFIFLWSLLLLVPGIIAMYRYRMALYLLLEHPEMSALQCISESKRLMVGHKGELFWMDIRLGAACRHCRFDQRMACRSNGTVDHRTDNRRCRLRCSGAVLRAAVHGSDLCRLLC